MILTDKEIGRLVSDVKLIEPFNEEHLQATSYDLTMSDRIQTLSDKQKRMNLYSLDSISSLYREKTIETWYDLKPQEFVLVRIREKINMPENLAAHIRPRTTFNKLGLMLTAQHLNPTYCGHLYLGLYNATPAIVEISPGLKIGQIVFEELTDVPSEQRMYKNKKDAKYHGEDAFITSKIYEENVEGKKELQKFLSKISG